MCIRNSEYTFGIPNTVFGISNTIFGTLNAVFGIPNRLFGISNAVFGIPNRLSQTVEFSRRTERAAAATATTATAPQLLLFDGFGSPADRRAVPTTAAEG